MDDEELKELKWMISNYIFNHNDYMMNDNSLISNDSLIKEEGNIFFFLLKKLGYEYKDSIWINKLN